MYYSRNTDVILRREHFGGIAFNKNNGRLLELDRDACMLLELTDGKTSLRTIAKRIESDLNTKVGISEIRHIVEVLRKQGFLIKSIGDAIVHPKSWPQKTKYLSAPESVHLAITHRCNHRCQSCYVNTNEGGKKREMTTAQIKSLIDEMAEMKVFQLAIGGGEPFLRDDLFELVTYSRRRGIVPNITTNGALITTKIISGLKDVVGQIQLSVNGHNRKRHEISRQKGSFDTVFRAMEFLREKKILFGMNVLLCKANFKEIENIIEFGVEQNASTINFIRPKPSKLDDNWYGENALSSDDYLVVASTLRKSLNKFPSARITVDCALAFLMNTEKTDFLQQRGVYGCTGAKRFISIHPDGSVYPCSFLDKYCGGNVLQDGLKKVWEDGFLELRGAHLTGKCEICENMDFCMGCRAIVLHEKGDICAGDDGCFR